MLRIVRHWVPEAAAVMNKCMTPLIDHIVAAKPWRLPLRNYIGAAHGVIGIITQVVLCDPAAFSGRRAESLSELLDLGGRDGHWFITDDPNLSS